MRRLTQVLCTLHLALSRHRKIAKNDVNNQAVPPQNDVVMKNKICFSNQRPKFHHLRPQRKIDSKMVKKTEHPNVHISKLIDIFCSVWGTFFIEIVQLHGF